MKTNMKVLNFKDCDKKMNKEIILKAAYEQYSGRKFPLCKKEEYQFLLECAETDLINEGRDLQEEIYTLTERNLLEDVRIALFGQWRNSPKKHRNVLKEIRELFSDENHFLQWVQEALNKYSLDYKDYSLNYKEKHTVKRVFSEGWVLKSPMKWGI